jgi:hypothetical protein
MLMFRSGGLKGGTEMSLGTSPEMSLQRCPPPLQAHFSFSLKNL